MSPSGGLRLFRLGIPGILLKGWTQALDRIALQIAGDFLPRAGRGMVRGGPEWSPLNLSGWQTFSAKARSENFRLVSHM